MNNQLENSNPWEERLQNWQQSGLSIRAWCNTHNIGEHLFYYWRNKLKSKQSKNELSNFIELVDHSSDTGIKIQVKEVNIFLAKNFDKATFLECIRLLRAI